jgi:adenine-specific DNA-methyltransferase
MLHRIVLAHTPAIRRLLQIDLPAALLRLEPRARQTVCSALLAFCRQRWPARRLHLLRSYASAQRYAPLSIGDGGTFTWPRDGQYYIQRNGGEFWIHRNLLESLRRELRAFAVTEANGVLDHVKALLEIGDLLFVVLDSIESELRTDFETSKTIVDLEYCLPLDCIPRSLISTVLANIHQRREWKRLYGDVLPPSVSSKKVEPYRRLVVDTRHFPPAFHERLENDGVVNPKDVQGILVHGDNLDAMRTLLQSYRDKVRCVYVDPPYNTGGSQFLYRDRFHGAGWLSMIDNRLELARHFLSPDGSIFVQIDYAEKERLRLLLDRYFTYQTEIIWRIGWISGFKAAAKKFIRNHDTIYHYSRSEIPYFQKRYIPYPPGYTRRDGSPPTGQGYPLEDTWNCSEIDRLDSIQIMSFSREKVGAPALTQKNENLLERIIASATAPRDTVMDFFAGTGTTCAVAHKMGRHWIGIECGDWFMSHTLPRMKRVLAGDPHGISPSYNWKGGGAFCYMILADREKARLRTRGRG